MRKLIAELTGIVLRHSPVFYERKRIKLSMRLHSIFDMDLLEGLIDSGTRQALAKN